MALVSRAPLVVTVSNVWVFNRHQESVISWRRVFSPMTVCVGIEFISSIENAVKVKTSFMI